MIFIYWHDHLRPPPFLLIYPLPNITSVGTTCVRERVCGGKREREKGGPLTLLVKTKVPTCPSQFVLECGQLHTTHTHISSTVHVDKQYTVHVFSTHSDPESVYNRELSSSRGTQHMTLSRIFLCVFSLANDLPPKFFFSAWLFFLFGDWFASYADWFKVYEVVWSFDGKRSVRLGSPWGVPDLPPAQPPISLQK